LPVGQDISQRLFQRGRLGLVSASQRLSVSASQRRSVTTLSTSSRARGARRVGLAAARG